jgi:hypothetical protein
MSKVAELELSVFPLGGILYEVALTSKPSGSDTAERVAGKASIDPDALSLEDTADAYGTELGKALFADDVLRHGLERARILAQAAGAKLRVRLQIDGLDDKLHSVRWETLRDAAGAELLTGPDLWFSRYLASEKWDTVHSRAATGLKAMVAIASPIELETNPQGKAPIPIADEKARAEAALAGLNPIFLARVPGAQGTPTQADIIDRLKREDFDVLYLVCHGGILDGEPVLWLEDANGKVDSVKASTLIEAMARAENPLRLVVLASCESAGSEESANALAGFGPRLAAAGIPAVIAMQGKITMETAKTFMSEFFQELMKDGQIDRAMAVARGAVVNDKRPDYWKPALFLRLLSGSLWYAAGFGDPEAVERWPSIVTALAKKPPQCTPILGPGMTEDLIGSSRQIAQAMAKDHGFPLAPWSLEDLPTVAQYLAVKQTTRYPREQLSGMIRDGLIARFGEDLKDVAFDRDDLNAVLSAVGKLRRDTRPMEPHKVLASKPFKIYITVNPDELMEDALREAKRCPMSEYARWNEKISNIRKYPTLDELNRDYVPTVQHPLVYHLYGKLSVPESLVITEDDYFDYLLRIASKAETKTATGNTVSSALTDDALLFIGFRLEDWSFRVLLRSIYSKEGSGARAVDPDAWPCVGAQLLPEKGRMLEPEGTKKYYQDYLRSSKIDIFWGRVEDFIRELDHQTAALTAKVDATTCWQGDTCCRKAVAS